MKKRAQERAHGLGDALRYHVRIYSLIRGDTQCPVCSVSRYRAAMDTKAYAPSRVRATSSTRTGSIARRSPIHVIPCAPTASNPRSMWTTTTSATCKATPRTTTEHSPMLERGQPLSVALALSSLSSDGLRDEMCAHGRSAWARRCVMKCASRMQNVSAYPFLEIVLRSGREERRERILCV